ncbi:hypothetical protein [Solitalea canadensis]|uniref:hypothetical protein n=1 Tax=Solitalea canadensis TaxID=995 RepID=UPI0012F78FC0
MFGVNTPNSTDTFREHTIVTQGDYYFPLKWRIETEIRNSFDWSINNGDVEPRYRPRVRFSKDFHTEYLTFSSYLYREYFLDFADADHNRWRPTLKFTTSSNLLTSPVLANSALLV